MSRSGRGSILAYSAFIAGCVLVEDLVTAGDEPALIASLAFALAAAASVGAGFISGRGRALLVFPAVAVGTLVVVQLLEYGGWWIEDSGDQGLMAVIFTLFWLYIATFVLLGLGVRWTVNWLRSREPTNGTRDVVDATSQPSEPIA